MLASRYVRIQIKSLWDSAFMDQKFDLFQVDYVRELKNKLLRIGAESGTFPS